MVHAPARWLLSSLALTAALTAAVRGPTPLAALTAAASLGALALLWSRGAPGRRRLRAAALLGAVFPVASLVAGVARGDAAATLASAAGLAALHFSFLAARDEQRRSVIDGVLRASGQLSAS
jgi:hypothetical protein